MITQVECPYCSSEGSDCVDCGGSHMADVVLTDSGRVLGCGNPKCQSCMSLEGDGPWCPRCGVAVSQPPLERHLRPFLVWADLCESCDALMRKQ